MHAKYHISEEFPTWTAALAWEDLKKDPQGLVPVIIID